MNTITELSTFESEKSQKIFYEKKYFGVTFVDLDVVSKEAYFATNHAAFEYNIAENYKNKDIKKIFFNAFIFHLTEYIKQTKGKIVFYYSNTPRQFAEDTKFESVNQYIIKRCSVLLPIIICTKDILFSDYVQRCEQDDIETVSEMQGLALKVIQFSNTTFTLKKLNTFLKKNELTFLRNAYFTQHQTKLALFT